MATINLNEKFHDLETGEIIKDQEQLKDENGIVKTDRFNIPLTKDGKPMTLKIYIIRALLAIHIVPANRQTELVDGAEKDKRGELAERIKAEKELITLEAEEITLIKRLIGWMYPAEIVRQAYKYLELTTKEKDKEKTKDIPSKKKK